MAKVKKIKILQYAKVQTVIMAYAGLVMGLIYSIGGFIIDASTGNIGMGTALAFLAIPIMPIYFAVFGFVAAVVGGLLFNWTSKWYNGMKVEIK